MTTSHAPEIQFKHRFMTQSPKVGFVATYFNRIGGTESFHKLLLPNIPNLVGFAYEMGDGNPVDLGVPAQGGTEAIRKLCQACDVIVTWGISTLPELLPARRPRIINVHHGSIYSPWSNEVLESIMPVADKVVTVCPLVLQQQLAQGRDAVCIPNAIDPRRTASARKISKSKIRSQFDIPSDLKIALWCHRFSYEKRPDLAVVIGNALPDDWLLLMAGSGPYELLNWVSPKVRLLGPIDNPANLLSIADIFLSTGDAEGFGLAMGEAMLSDIPVVATPLGIAADPQLAHQVPVDASIDDWVTAIVKASLSDPSLATVARHLAERRYGFGQHLAAWTNVINEVFAGPAISN